MPTAFKYQLPPVRNSFESAPHGLHFEPIAKQQRLLNQRGHQPAITVNSTSNVVQTFRLPELNLKDLAAFLTA
jgi:hypothetical protein